MTSGTLVLCPTPSASRKSNAPPKNALSKSPDMSCLSPLSPPWCTPSPVSFSIASGAGFAGRVRGGAHAPEAMENDTGDGVHHGGESGDRQDICGDFDSAVCGGAFDFLEALGVGHRTNVPDVIENGARVGDQKRRKFAVVIPGAGDGGFVEFLGLLVEEERGGRNVSLRAVQTNVALALLLGIVKGMRVEKRPDELAADVFKAEFEMGVLIDGVMATVERGGAD